MDLSGFFSCHLDNQCEKITFSTLLGGAIILISMVLPDIVKLTRSAPVEA